jgi:hypothetical protein
MKSGGGRRRGLCARGWQLEESKWSGGLGFVGRAFVSDTCKAGLGWAGGMYWAGGHIKKLQFIELPPVMDEQDLLVPSMFLNQ